MPHWRKITWALLLWLILGVAAAAYWILVACNGLTGDARADCEMVEFILQLWFFTVWGILALSLAALWGATRPRSG